MLLLLHSQPQHPTAPIHERPRPSQKPQRLAELAAQRGALPPLREYKLEDPRTLPAWSLPGDAVRQSSDSLLSIMSSISKRSSSPPPAWGSFDVKVIEFATVKLPGGKISALGWEVDSVDQGQPRVANSLSSSTDTFRSDASSLPRYHRLRRRDQEVEKDALQFGATEASTRVLGPLRFVRLQICNTSMAALQVTVEMPMPPFYIRAQHTSFLLPPCAFFMLPLKFAPREPGVYESLLRVKGELERGHGQGIILCEALLRGNAEIE